MNNDKYLNKKIAEYLLLNIKKKTKNGMEDEFFTLVHQILTLKEIKTLTDFFIKDLNEFIERRGVKKKLKNVSKETSYQYRESRLRDKIEELEESYKDTETWGYKIESLIEANSNVKSRFIKEIGKTISRKNHYRGTSVYEKHLKKLASIFMLNQKEQDLVTLFYLISVDDRVESFFTHLGLRLSRMNGSARVLYRFFDYTPASLRTLLNKKSNLVRSGILTKEKTDNGSVGLNTRIESFLAGFGEEDIISTFFKLEKDTNRLKQDDFLVSADMISSTKDLLRSDKGVNILLHGVPGAGKTEFSKFLGTELGMKVYYIGQNDDDGEEDLNFRKSGIVAAQNILDPKNTIIVVDECDNIVNVRDAFWNCEVEKGGDKKAWINYLLESSKHNIIWISNRVNGVDDSTKRRFSYSIEFKTFTVKQRMKIWETIINKEKIDFISNDQIEMLAQKYKVNAGGISLAIQDVMAMPQLISKEDKIQRIDALLAQHQEFVFGLSTDISMINSHYKLDLLNCDMNMDLVVSSVQHFLKYISDKKNTDIQNMNFLLQGPPGTGKTEFVKFLAKTAGAELLVKRLSDIRSKWYGESLQNIAAIFKEASAEGKILFLDEADSFFTDRANSSEHSVAETNELLTQMENFKGILICATNFSSMMDPASMRRFNFKIKFDYLSNDGKLRMFQQQFGKYIKESMPMEFEKRVMGINYLTPGDFKVVYQKNAFMENVAIETLIGQLEMEVSYKKGVSKPIRLG
ncbi:AAA family ATPase [Bacteriovorax sp. PP10]|uniref:AAA family ATPase n=1 Tax=Bacteriovorax antarcticus TaxID=3088717 RepID=A0ABU5VY58_9BACT|nr:AAA family ATPase [Bacteriovorax sp. PP10]MEA9357254.1 AAA family ATPase [Bacteriovorax sp. PP10]